MSQLAPAPAPVVRLIPDLIEYAAERFGERPFLQRYASGTWSGYTFMAAARAVRAALASDLPDAVSEENKSGDALDRLLTQSVAS